MPHPLSLKTHVCGAILGDKMVITVILIQPTNHIFVDLLENTLENVEALDVQIFHEPQINENRLHYQLDGIPLHNTKQISDPYPFF